MKKLVLSFVLTVVTMNFLACAPSNGTLTVNDAWARPARAGENGAAYFIIENDSESDDNLLSVSSNIATTAEVHMSMMDENGVMSMQMQEAVVIPGKGQLEFKPGGLHVMFVSLNRDLKVGNTITLILRFEKAGEITVQVAVKEQ